MPLSHITTRSSPTALSSGKFDETAFATLKLKELFDACKFDEVEIFGTPLPKPQPDADGNYDADATFQPFWWIGTNSNKALANMSLTTKPMKGVDVPMLENHVAIKAGAQLFKYAAAPERRVSIVPKAKAAKAARHG